MVASCGAAGLGNADPREPPIAPQVRPWRLLPSQPPRSGFVHCPLINACPVDSSCCAPVSSPLHGRVTDLFARATARGDTFCTSLAQNSASPPLPPRPPPPP